MAKRGTPRKRSPLTDEVVVQRNGQPRQAGASVADGRQIAVWRTGAERSLYIFARAFLDMHWLSPSLHPPVCAWLQSVPPYRKFLLMPRNHCKSTLIGQAMPLHMFIQPRDANIYFPYAGPQPGTDTRILIVGESEDMATRHVGIIASHLTSNDLLRAFWPHIVWDQPRRESRHWSSQKINVRREREFPEPSVQGVGVGTAIVGVHPNVLIKDDLTTEEAANSPTVMQSAIAWHENSRALLAHPDTDLEFVTGTRWAVSDLPDRVMADPTVETNAQWRQMVEDGAIIYPEKFGYEGAVESLRAQHGSMFPLLYFNTVTDSGLVDFDPADLRSFEIIGDVLRFDGDQRDADIVAALSQPAPPPPPAPAAVARDRARPKHAALELARRRVADILEGRF